MLLRHWAIRMSSGSMPASAPTASLLASTETPPTASKLGGGVGWEGEGVSRMELSGASQKGVHGRGVVQQPQCGFARAAACCNGNAAVASPPSPQLLHRLKFHILQHAADVAGSHGVAIGSAGVHRGGQHVLRSMHSMQVLGMSRSARASALHLCI